MRKAENDDRNNGKENRHHDPGRYGWVVEITSLSSLRCGIFEQRDLEDRRKPTIQLDKEQGLPFVNSMRPQTFRCRTIS